MSDDLGGPKTVGRFEALHLLGEGGMARVFLARAYGGGGFARIVVQKRLHAHFLDDADAVARLENEARVAASVHHANVVGVQDVGQDEEGFFLVLDYVEGDSLAGLVERSLTREIALPPRVIARILLDGLNGLHAVHEARGPDDEPLGVIHRDVTPQNLLVGRDGVTRVADFGVAKGLTARVAQAQTQSGVLVGKLMYMPPEYLRQQPTDRRGDVYSMGITAWYAFVGDKPFSVVGEGRMVFQILKQGVPPLPPVAGVPDAIAEVVRRACERSADARYATAAEMASALEHAARSVDGLATHAEVADVVAALCGDVLEARRATLAAAIAASDARRAPPPDKSAVPPRTPQDPNRAIVGAASEPVVPGEVVTGERFVPPRGRNVRVGVVASVLALCVIVGLAATRRGASPSAAPAEPAPVQTVSSAQSTSSVPVSLPTAAPSASDSAPPPPAREPSRVTPTPGLTQPPSPPPASPRAPAPPNRITNVNPYR